MLLWYIKYQHVLSAYRTQCEGMLNENSIHCLVSVFQHCVIAQLHSLDFGAMLWYKPCILLGYDMNLRFWAAL